MMAQIYRQNLLFLLAAPTTFGLFSYSAYLLTPVSLPPFPPDFRKQRERGERSFSAKSTRQIGACK